MSCSPRPREIKTTSIPPQGNLHPVIQTQQGKLTHKRADLATVPPLEDASLAEFLPFETGWPGIPSHSPVRREIFHATSVHNDAKKCTLTSCSHHDIKQTNGPQHGPRVAAFPFAWLAIRHLWHETWPPNCGSWMSVQPARNRVGITWRMMTVQLGTESFTSLCLLRVRTHLSLHLVLHLSDTFLMLQGGLMKPLLHFLNPAGSHIHIFICTL